MEKERIFNLQLTVQKLEEELSLYRNGTTSQELMEYIAEKDSEIDELKHILNEKNENLRKIAKSSSDVLARCEQLQNENNELQVNINQLSKNLSIKEEELQNQKFLLNQADEDKAKKSEIISEFEIKITKLEMELSDRSDSIDKLQQRCAALVSEKSEKSKSLEKEKSERTRQVKELRDELARSMRINTELNQKLNSEQNENLELADKLRIHDLANNELKRNLANLQKRYETEKLKLEESLTSQEHNVSTLQFELSEAQGKLMILTSRNASLEDTLRTKQSEYLLSAKLSEEKNAELNRTIVDINNELRLQKQRNETELRHAEETRRSEVDKLTRINEANIAKIAKLEVEKENSVVRKKEFDANLHKIADLESRIKSQDAFFKRRLLGERVNGITMDSIDSSSGVGTNAASTSGRKSAHGTVTTLTSSVGSSRPSSATSARIEARK